MKPDFAIEMFLHPKAQDGKPNAWKILMRDKDGVPILTDTANTAADCLVLATKYLRGDYASMTINVPEGLAEMLTRIEF